MWASLHRHQCIKDYISVRRFWNYWWNSCWNHCCCINEGLEESVVLPASLHGLTGRQSRLMTETWLIFYWCYNWFFYSWVIVKMACCGQINFLYAGEPHFVDSANWLKNNLNLNINLTPSFSLFSAPLFHPPILLISNSQWRWRNKSCSQHNGHMQGFTQQRGQAVHTEITNQQSSCTQVDQHIQPVRFITQSTTLIIHSFIYTVCSSVQSACQ